VQYHGTGHNDMVNRIIAEADIEESKPSKRETKSCRMS
jgi:hypothetical protein